MKNHPIIDQIIDNSSEAYINLTPDELIDHALKNNEGRLTSDGALAADTGEFTGRSPKDKFVVEDDITRDTVWWGSINQPIAAREV